jgi:hypothetical protein
MKVKNLKGTSPNVCNCGSWLNHWKNFRNIYAISKTLLPKQIRCSVISCPNLAELGGHVQKVNSNDKDWYIIPLCDRCNKKEGEELDIDNNTVLVSANVSETCG